MCCEEALLSWVGLPPSSNLGCWAKPRLPSLSHCGSAMTAARASDFEKSKPPGWQPGRGQGGRRDVPFLCLGLHAAALRLRAGFLLERHISAQEAHKHAAIYRHTSTPG